jgi:hypothetical protein
MIWKGRLFKSRSKNGSRHRVGKKALEKRVNLKRSSVLRQLIAVNTGRHHPERVATSFMSNTMVKVVQRSRPISSPSFHSLPSIPPNASVGKRWRFRRNIVIYVAHRSGLSQRFLADVFDLPRSRIASIINDFSKFS